ncbi:MAG: divalent metal cation transporter [Chloroflexi bacterium]|nr:divalent metal cation transporter [Chloroflexota bacterium]
MGPGIITANVNNDATGITAYSIAGATFGYRMLWPLFLSILAAVLIQEIAARMGVVTGKGLSDLIRENFGVEIALLAIVALVVANAFTTVAEFAGVAASLEIFGVSKYISVPLAAGMVWFLVIRGSYRMIERIFLGGVILYGSYVLSGFLVRPPWGEVLSQAITPSFELTAPFVGIFIAQVGTTVTPWMQFYLQSSVADKGIAAEAYPYERLDVFLGAFATLLSAFFIIVTAAATLHVRGIPIATAQDAALALEPLAGSYAEALFAIGLLNASILGAAILPLSTAYAACEAFGWERGLNRSFREAPVFLGLYSALILMGAVVALWPGIPLVQVMFIPNVVNGILLPLILIFMLRLVGDRRIMGEHRNGPVFNAVGWFTGALLILLSILYLFVNLFPTMGALR